MQESSLRLSCSSITQTTHFGTKTIRTGYYLIVRKEAKKWAKCTLNLCQFPSTDNYMMESTAKPIYFSQKFQKILITKVFYIFLVLFLPFFYKYESNRNVFCACILYNVFFLKKKKEIGWVSFLMLHPAKRSD